MGLTISDEELVHMSASELRALLLRRQVTAEEHKQLRSRRRRLQNRKYARKCALKKLTEVENLAIEVKEESSEVQALRQQLNHLSVVTRRIQHQEATLASFRRNLESNTRTRSASVSASIRMLHSDGTLAGFAYPSPVTVEALPPDMASSATRTHNLEPIVPKKNAAICQSTIRPTLPTAVTTKSLAVGSHLSSMPLQLAAGPGMPSTTSALYSAWPPSDSNALNPCMPVHLVRPVGCGFTARGRNMVEF